MNKILATGLLGLALVSALPAVAADSKADKTWQEAWTAYNIGQYKKTLRLLQPLDVYKRQALGFPHGRRNEVFRSDQFQFGDLALGFQGDGTGQFRVLKQDFVHSTALPLG